MSDHMLLQKYSNKWAADFQIIKAKLSDVLTGIPISIKHIGSTAVPGMTAKPIIDIDIAFSNKNDFDKIKKVLELVGYYYNGNQGIADREVFKRATTDSYDVLDTIAHHLYVCPSHSEELRRHLLFRNYLRLHEEARNKYLQLKQQLAHEANQDRKIYANLKEEKAKAFIEEVIAKAALLQK